MFGAHCNDDWGISRCSEEQATDLSYLVGSWKCHGSVKLNFLQFAPSHYGVPMILRQIIYVYYGPLCLKILTKSFTTIFENSNNCWANSSMGYEHPDTTWIETKQIFIAVINSAIKRIQVSILCCRSGSQRPHRQVMLYTFKGFGTWKENSQ